MQQTDAFHLLTLGKNIFLTGAAGSGKTFVLNQYIKYLKDNNVQVAVTASTGIAATHLQGTTIHSWSGMGIRERLTTQDLEKIATNKRIKKNFKKTNVLIIDEISMLHCYQLDMIDSIARFFLDSSKVFGGLQVVLCGDFFQLPPVSTASSEVENYFAFQSVAWKQGDFYVCYLHEQHRQSNDPLMTVLNDIRSGQAGEHTKIPLRTRYKKEPVGNTKATKLYTRNINVDAINEHELANLKTQKKTFIMKTTGFSALIEGIKRNCLALEQLTLKVGAEVMFIKNHPLARYVNGTRGVVIGFDEADEGWPIVKTYDNKIVCACHEEWTYEDHGIVRATIKQVPLRLAWAITIHKSQGMTLDAAEIDLGDTFEPGMGYVALSRVRSLSGLKIMNLNEMALKVHPMILQHDHVFKDCSEIALSYLNSLSEKEKEIQQRATLKERFKAKARPLSKIDSNQPKLIPSHLITLEHLEGDFSLESVAASRGLTVDTIITHIEKLKGLKKLTTSQLSHLKKCISLKDFDLIFTALNDSKDGKIKPIYEALEGKYSYSDIKIVRLFVLDFGQTAI
jgi:ATP-dependent DNA helicase PIF1